MMVDEEFEMIVKDNVSNISSRAVAKYFGKRHDNILRDIRNLECSEAFRRLNFIESTYVDKQNKIQPEILMTRNGFIFLVMGFTGKKAAKIKEACIRVYNQMQECVKYV